VSYYLGFQGGKGNQVYSSFSPGLVDISDHPDLDDILVQPYNYYLLEDGTTLQYHPERQPLWTYHLDNGRWVPNTDLLSQLRDSTWQAIKARRDLRKDGGVKAGTKWFHTDASSRVQHLGLRLLGAAIPPGLMWKTMDGSLVEMTPSLCASIFLAVLTQDTQTFAVAEQHRSAVYASLDPVSYDFTTGWPPIFGE
jgi:hypothetical protein